MIACYSGAVSVSGSNVEVLAGDFRGIGPCRLFVKNAGSQALTAASLKGGPASGALATLDSTTFASLGASAVLQVAIAAPVDYLSFIASCAAGTTIEAWLMSGVGD